jgi:uncharacterized repeat protein (TIGR01451 family)
VLDWITDTLPVEFVFNGMHPSGDWDEPPARIDGPVIVWQGPITVPQFSTLSLVYSVRVPRDVPPSATPYTNTVIGSSGGELIGPAIGYLLVGETELSLDKSVAPGRVVNGEAVTYTVSIANSGEVTGTVAVISDTLDEGLTFGRMAEGSDVSEPPEQVGGVLVWTGPYTVGHDAELVVTYVVTTPAELGWGRLCNRVEAVTSDGDLGPVASCVDVSPESSRAYLPVIYKNVHWAHFTVAKTVVPEELEPVPGAEVVYTVVIVNEGDYPGVVGSVYDILPDGFTYVDMVNGSDVMDDPSGTTGRITWEGPFDVAAHEELRLIYRATINQTPGEYVNVASVIPLVGNAPRWPGSATVTVGSPILLDENFDDTIDRWTKFLNYWRLTEGQWYWDSDDGVNDSGAADHRCCGNPIKEAEDALLMYLGEGAEQWTDYRVEAKFNLHEGAGPVGLWVRGQWEPSDIRAQWVTGYYIVTGGRANAETHFVKIAQLQTTTDCWDKACETPENLYNFNNSHDLVQVSLDGPLTRNAWHTLVVEVQGARIVVWMDGVQALDWTDPKEPFLTGTVGLKTYGVDWVSYDDVVVTPLE